MEKAYTADKLFDSVDFSAVPPATGEYEDCRFINCNFANTNLSGIHFNSCSFDNCNLSMAMLGATAFRDTKFTGCKLLGLHFEHCNEYGLTIELDNCILNHASFYKRKLKELQFRDCKMLEVDFTEADLTGAVFSNCDLAGAVFDRTILEKADLRTAYHYMLDPETNRVKKAKFSADGIAGLLSKYDITIE